MDEPVWAFFIPLILVGVVAGVAGVVYVIRGAIAGHETQHRLRHTEDRVRHLERRLEGAIDQSRQRKDQMVRALTGGNYSGGPGLGGGIND